MRLLNVRTATAAGLLFALGLAAEALAQGYVTVNKVRNFRQTSATEVALFAGPQPCRFETCGTATARSFSGTWWSYTGGQTLTGAWRQNTRSNSNVAPVTITFSGADTALMTLPNGRTTNLRRHRF